MPGQRLDDLHWRVAFGQRRDEAVAQSVKVGESIFVLVFDAGHGLVALESGQNRPSTDGKKRSTFRLAMQPRLEEQRKGGLDRLDVALAALAVHGLNRDGGTRAFQVE